METTSAVRLYSLIINRKGELVIRATRAFVGLLRTLTSSRDRTCIRIGSFEIYDVGRGYYRALPDDDSPKTRREGESLANRILAKMRFCLLMERVFAAPGSFESWMAINHRPIQLIDLNALALVNRVPVPFLSIPFDHRNVKFLSRAPKDDPQKPTRKVAVKPVKVASPVSDLANAVDLLRARFARV